MNSATLICMCLCISTTSNIPGRGLMVVLCKLLDGHPVGGPQLGVERRCKLPRHNQRFQRLARRRGFSCRTSNSAAVPLEFLSASWNHSFYGSAPESGAWDMHQFLPFTFCLIMFLRSWAVIYLIAVEQFLTDVNAFSPCRLTNVQKSPPSSHFTVISYSPCTYSGFLLWNGVLLFFFLIFLFFFLNLRACSRFTSSFLPQAVRTFVVVHFHNWKISFHQKVCKMLCSLSCSHQCIVHSSETISVPLTKQL